MREITRPKNWCRGLAATVGLTLLSACAAKPDPTPAESAIICPQLKREISDDETQFHAKGPLHKLIATDLSKKATAKMLNGERRLPPNRTSNENMYDGVMTECIPLYAEDKCKPVAKEFTDYNDRQFRRMIKQLQSLCVSRGLS